MSASSRGKTPNHTTVEKCRIHYPKQMNDDWFWLYAGVVSTTANSSSIIISNDQMRDHHFQMLSMKHFLKWRERHWVNRVLRQGLQDATDLRLPDTVLYSHATPRWALVLSCTPIYRAAMLCFKFSIVRLLNTLAFVLSDS